MPGSQNIYPLEIRLFGTWEARTHGRPLPPLRSRKERWLLALLALRFHTETFRETLAASLWPDVEKGQGLQYLRRSLSNLRQALGQEAPRLLSPTSRTLRLDLSDAFCDVLTFEQALAQAATATDPLPRLQQAVELYRGPLLPDCLEEWMLEERRHREHAYHNALERLANLCLQQQEPASAVGWLRRLILSDPYRESAVCSLMQALSDSGDRVAMQQVYQDLRRRLLHDLNAAPAPETESLFKRLSQRETRPDGVSAQPVSLPPSRRHLPVPLTDLIGREQEIVEVTGWLQRCRLVTLLGPGGVGKTRLAIATAEAVLPHFADGVWFVDLAPLQDASRVAETTARALAVSEQPDCLPEERLEAAIASRSLLLALDNCEQVQEAVAVLAYRLLSACPNLKILATSRHLLGVTGEQVYPVPSLALPPPDTVAGQQLSATAEKDPAFLLDYDGIRLFVQRAQQTNPAFRLDRKNGAMIVEICYRLDGIPLALEMAAARLRSLSVLEINTRLSDRFRLLTMGNRGAQPRQQTLRAALNWSYDLLNEAERALLNRLAVFVGGFTQEAAAALFPSEDAAWHMETLASLVDKSLLTVEGYAEPPRYRMLETVREYGLERLGEQGETEAARRLHQQFYSLRAKSLVAEWKRTRESQWLEILDRDLDNIRVGLAYGQETGDLDTSFDLQEAMVDYWQNYGSLSEGRRYLDAFLMARGDELSPRQRILTLNQTAGLAHIQADDNRALLYARKAARLALEQGERDQYGLALNFITDCYVVLRQYEEARPYFEERIAVWREQGRDDEATLAENHFQEIYSKARGTLEDYLRRQEDHLRVMREIGTPYMVISALHRMSYRHFCSGNYREAKPLCEEALQIARAILDRIQELICLQHLGWICLRLGDYGVARDCMLETLRIQKGMERAQELMTAMQALADIAMHEERWEYALCLYSITETMIQNRKLNTADGRELSTEAQLMKLRATLDTVTFDRLWQHGRSLTTTQSIEYALAEA